MQNTAALREIDKSVVRIEPIDQSGAINVFHIPPNIFRHPAWPEFEYDSSKSIRLAPDIQLRWLDEADAADPLNQIRMAVVSFGSSMTWKIIFSEAADSSESREKSGNSAVELAMKALLCAMLDDDLRKDVLKAIAG